MNRQQRLTARFLTRLLSTPRGRAHVLNQAADAESNGESAIFDRALARVDDVELAKLIRIHQEDEVRHAQLFRDCLARTGVVPPPVPQHLKLIERLNTALGDVFARPIVERRGIMDAYLILQVIEERAVTQFGLFKPIFRAVDPEAADVFAEVARDEERHLKYCRAIARRYAPDEATMAAELQRIRAVEARAFAANSRANLRYVLSHGVLDASPLETLLWNGLWLVSGVTRREDRTGFWMDARPSVDGARPVAEAA